MSYAPLFRVLYPVQCAWCKKLKDICSGTWEQGPAYLLEGYTHGACPDCRKKLDRELEESKKRKRES